MSKLNISFVWYADGMKTDFIEMVKWCDGFDKQHLTINRIHIVCFWFGHPNAPHILIHTYTGRERGSPKHLSSGSSIKDFSYVITVFFSLCLFECCAFLLFFSSKNNHIFGILLIHALMSYILIYIFDALKPCTWSFHFVWWWS